MTACSQLKEQCFAETDGIYHCTSVAKSCTTVTKFYCKCLHYTIKDIGLYQFYVTCTKHIAFWFASASPREPPANKITARVRDSKEDINFCSRLLIFRNSA